MSGFVGVRAVRILAGLGIAVIIAGCAKHGTTPVTTSSVHLVTPKSVSPGSIPAPPMAKTQIQPASAMSATHPQGGIKTMEAIAPANWVPIPGTATSVAASPDGSLWVLSDKPAGPDKFIWHYLNGAWTNISGMASRLAVGPDNTLYAINSAGGAYQYNPSNQTWPPLGGGSSDISVAGDGTLYVLSNGNAPGTDQAIWHYVNGGWTQFSGSGVRIAASWSPDNITISQGTLEPGGVYITNSVGAIYYENTSMTFVQLPGNGSAVAPTNDAGLFILSYPASGSGNTITYFDLDTQTFSQQGSATTISTDSNSLYATSSSNAIFYTLLGRQPGIALTLTNNSGLTPAYFFIVGANPSDTSDLNDYHVNASGQLVKVSLNDMSNTDPATGNKYADYNIPFPAPGTNFRMPLVRAGRIYISLGTKMKTVITTIHIGPPAPCPCGDFVKYIQPDGWANVADLNYKTLWDDVEFDYTLIPTSGYLPGLGVNKTEVQAYGLPFQITLTGPKTGTQTMGAKPNTRTAFMNALNADANFKSLLVPGPATGTSVSPIRAISLDQGIANKNNNASMAQQFPNATYYDDYINRVWSFYQTHTLTFVSAGFGTYTATVQGNNMVFTQAGAPDVAIPKPSTSDVIIGNGNLVTPCDQWALKTPQNDRCRQIGSSLSAAFNRTTLLVDQTLPRDANNPNGGCKPAEFYNNQNTGPTFDPTNLYSYYTHLYSLNLPFAPYGAAYGFGYDDNCNQSSFISDNFDPSNLTIVLEPF